MFACIYIYLLHQQAFIDGRLLIIHAFWVLYVAMFLDRHRNPITEAQCLKYTVWKLFCTWWRKCRVASFFKKKRCIESDMKVSWCKWNFEILITLAIKLFDGPYRTEYIQHQNLVAFCTWTCFFLINSAYLFWYPPCKKIQWLDITRITCELLSAYVDKCLKTKHYHPKHPRIENSQIKKDVTFWAFENYFIRHIQRALNAH